MAERHAQVDVGVVGIRALRHGDAGRGLRFLRPALRDQRFGEIEVRARGVRIVRDHVAEERHFIAVNARLPPRQRAEQRQHDRGAAHCARAPRRGQPADRGGRGADDDRHHPDTGQVLIPVRHERKEHVGVVHEAERRRQRHREERHAGQRPPADAVPQEPQRPDQRRRGAQTRPCERVPDVDVPVRIDDGQIRGPRQLADVEPDGTRRDQGPLDEGIAECGRRGRGDHPQVHGDEAQRHAEERCQPQQVSHAHAAGPPPVEYHQRRRQRDYHVFGQHPGGEQQQRQAVSPRAFSRRKSPGACGAPSVAGAFGRTRWTSRRTFQESEPRQDAGQIEQAGEHVFALDRPRDGFDVQRMDGEDRGDDPGAGHGQPQQNPPQQHGVGRVQQHVDHVVAGRREPPQFVFQPEAGVGQRSVVGLLHLARHEPYPPQAGPVPESRFSRNVIHVVPDEAAPQHRRQIAHDDQQDQHRRARHGSLHRAECPRARGTPLPSSRCRPFVCEECPRRGFFRAGGGCPALSGRRLRRRGCGRRLGAAFSPRFLLVGHDDAGRRRSGALMPLAAVPDVPAVRAGAQPRGRSHPG